MSIQRNVGQQNAETEDAVRRAAHAFAKNAVTFAWLRNLLRSRDLDDSDGILVKISEIPEQGGSYFKGVWLTRSEEFWEFEVVVPQAGSGLAEVERFERSPKQLVAESIKGTGKPFRRIALEVLRAASA